jgi:hypothetical protein
MREVRAWQSSAHYITLNYSCRLPPSVYDPLRREVNHSIGQIQAGKVDIGISSIGKDVAQFVLDDSSAGGWL